MQIAGHNEANDLVEYLKILSTNSSLLSKMYDSALLHWLFPDAFETKMCSLKLAHQPRVVVLYLNPEGQQLCYVLNLF